LTEPPKNVQKKSDSKQEARKPDIQTSGSLRQGSSFDNLAIHNIIHEHGLESPRLKLNLL